MGHKRFNELFSSKQKKKKNQLVSLSLWVKARWQMPKSGGRLSASKNVYETKIKWKLWGRIYTKLSDENIATSSFPILSSQTPWKCITRAVYIENRIKKTTINDEDDAQNYKNENWENYDHYKLLETGDILNRYYKTWIEDVCSYQNMYKT